MKPKPTPNNEKYLQQLEILQTFVLDIIKSETFEEVAKHVFDALEATIDPYLLGISWVRLGVLPGYVKIKGEEIKSGAGGVGMPLDGPGIMVRAVNTGMICNVPDTREDPTYVKDEAAGYLTLSVIAVPIQVNGKAIGALVMEEKESHAYDASDQNILEALAGYAGLSFRNIRYSDRLNGLHHHTSQLSVLTSIAQVAEHTLDAMTAALELETCTFLLSQNGELNPILEKGLDETIRLREEAHELTSFHDRLREADTLEFLSELEAPITIGSEVVAVLSAKSIRADAYSKQDNELVETLASHVASAIQRIRLLEAQIQYEAKLEALHEHANKLSNANDIQEISEHTIEAMSTPLGFTFGEFGLVDEKHITLLQTYGYDSSDETWQIPLDGPGVSVRTVKTGKTQLVNDTRKDVDFIGVDMDENTLSELDDSIGRRLGNVRILSELCVPVKIDNAVVAYLNAESTELNAFNEQDQKLLETLANHVASAIQRIRLLEEQIQYEAKLEALHLHTSNLADASSIEDIKEHTIDAMANSLGFSWAIFGIVEGNLLKFTIPKSLGGSGDPLDLSLDGPGLMIRAIRTGETQLIADVRKEVDYIGPQMNENTRIGLESTHSKRVKSAHSQLQARSPALSELDVPVKINQDVVGVICAESTELNAFTKQDQKLLETLASHIASAIQRIKLLEEQIRYEAKLEALHQHANDLTESITIEEIAEFTIEVMYATLGMKTCDFYSRENQYLRLISYKGWTPDEPEYKHPLDRPGILAKTANTKKTILLSDIRDEPNYFEYEGIGADGEQAYQALSELCVPVIYDDEVVAVLNTESNQLDFYGERDKVLLETLASHVSSAIQRIRLLDEQIQYEAKLEALHQHAIQLIKAEDIDKIADYTADAMSNTLGYRYGLFLMIEGDHLKSLRSIGKYTYLPEPIPLGSIGLINKTVNTGETQLVTDTRLNKNYRTSGIINLSELDVPLIIENKVIGVLNIENEEQDSFTEQDKILLETLASHVTSAIQRIRFIEEQIQYEAKLEALHVHANKLADASSLEEIADNTHDAMVNTLGVGGEDWGGLLGIVEDNFVTWGLESHLERSQSPIDSPGITYRAIKTGETQLVTDTRKDDDFVVHQDRAQELGVQMDTSLLSKLDEKVRIHLLEQRDSDGLGVSLSELDVPVKIGDTVVAILNAESILLNAFSEHDKKLLETLAGHVASAIQKIRLLDDKIQYEGKLEALHIHTSKLADAENIEEITDYTLEAMENTLGFTWASMVRVEGNFITIVIQSRSGIRTQNDTGPQAVDGPGITNRAVRTGETQLVNDVRKDDDYVGVFMAENKLSNIPDDVRQFILNARKHGGEDYRTLSEIEVPVKIGQTVVAILGAESLELNAFTEQDKSLIETLANHVASAMMRLQHTKEREQVQQELALERVRVEQADELSRLKNQFISTATHELRTPVTSILGFLELVLDYSSEDLPDSVKNDLNIVFRNALRLVDMTNDLLDVQRITSGRFEIILEQTDLMKTLNEVVEELTPLFNEKQQMLVVEAPSELNVHIDEVRISQLFINLIRNANKFTPDEGNITIKVEPVENHIQISFKDSGIGLNEEDIGKLFKPFPAIRHGVNVVSTGLGLAICKGIVDLHKGDIWVESEGTGTGSTFIVKIPVGQ